MPRYMPRTLIKKYALTSTAYKFLDTEIVIGSHMQIAIGNNRTACSLHAMWKTFIERRADIERLMQSISSSSSIQDLNVELLKYMIRVYDTNNVKFTLNDTCLYYMYNFASAIFFRNSRLYCKKLVIHL